VCVCVFVLWGLLHVSFCCGIGCLTQTWKRIAWAKVGCMGGGRVATFSRSIDMSTCVFVWEVGMQHFQGLLICPLVFCVGEVGMQHFEGPLMFSKRRQQAHIRKNILITKQWLITKWDERTTIGPFRIKWIIQSVFIVYPMTAHARKNVLGFFFFPPHPDNAFLCAIMGEKNYLLVHPLGPPPPIEY
jgi:hypothetical protein